MVKHLKKCTYDTFENDHVYKVYFSGEKCNLILTDECLKIGEIVYDYYKIYKFGHNKKNFWFLYQTSPDTDITLYVKSKKSKTIYKNIYQKCLELSEILKPNLSRLPDIPTFLPENEKAPVSE